MSGWVDAFHKQVLLRLDPETAHLWVTRGLKLAMRVAGVSNTQKLLENFVGAPPSPWRAKIGLAGGFDKNAEWLPVLPSVGFGFSEVGTVTPRPQVGNPRPRLFRLKEQRALFNQMGFNNDGAALIVRRVERARRHLPDDFKVWINIGKNADTDLMRASQDYGNAAKELREQADAWVVNVSSPNTVGLRKLQSTDALSPILESVQKYGGGRPMFVKLAPELSGPALQELIEEVELRFPVEGWVLTNTLGGQWKLRDGTVRMGGWSGPLLTEISRQRLKEARAWTEKKIISVGGVDSADEVEWRIQAGASAVQIYTAWVYGGVSFVADLLKSLPQK